MLCPRRNVQAEAQPASAGRLTVLGDDCLATRSSQASVGRRLRGTGSTRIGKHGASQPPRDSWRPPLESSLVCVGGLMQVGVGSLGGRGFNSIRSGPRKDCSDTGRCPLQRLVRSGSFPSAGPRLFRTGCLRVSGYGVPVKSPWPPLP